MPGTTDSVKWQASLQIDRYDADAIRQAGLVNPTAADLERVGLKPYETTTVANNLLTTAGLTRLTSLLTGGGGQAVTNTSARLGVGNGAGTAAVADTDLSASAGSGNRWFQPMDATYPTVAGALITFRATFGTADGNFAWNEWGIDVGTPTVTAGNTVAALLLNHKTSIAQGTKAAGQVWTATATITLS